MNFVLLAVLAGLAVVGLVAVASAIGAVVGGMATATLVYVKRPRADGPGEPRVFMLNPSQIAGLWNAVCNAAARKEEPN